MEGGNGGQPTHFTPLILNWARRACCALVLTLLPTRQHGARGEGVSKDCAQPVAEQAADAGLQHGQGSCSQARLLAGLLAPAA